MALLLLAAAGLALRLRAALQEPVWGDELYSRTIALLSLGEALDRVAREDVFNPPLYYLLVGASLRVFGDGLLALRLVSLLAGVGVILATGLLARRWLRSDTAALLAATLVTASDVQVNYSHEARSYALYALLVLAMLRSLEHALGAGRRRSPWLGFSAVCAALAYTHYVGWLYVAATLPVAWGAKRLRAWVVSVVLAGLLFAPWAAAVASHALAQQGRLGWLGRVPLDAAPRAFARFGGLPPIPGGAALSLSIALVPAVLGAVSLLRRRRERPAPERAAIVLACVLPPLALFAVGLVRPIWHARYLVPSQALWCMVLAAGVGELHRRRSWVAVGFALSLVGLQVGGMTPFLSDRRNPPHDELAAFLRANVAGRGPVLVTSDFIIGEPLRYYAGRDLDVVPLPEEGSSLPAELWVAFRPRSSEEAQRVRALEDRGWREVRKAYFSTPTNREYGTEVRLLRRER